MCKTDSLLYERRITPIKEPATMVITRHALLLATNRTRQAHLRGISSRTQSRRLCELANVLIERNQEDDRESDDLSNDALSPSELTRQTL